MDSLQVQIRELRDKIDRLYEIIQCLDDRVRQLSEGKRSTFEKSSYSSGSSTKATKNSTLLPDDSNYQITHKDILVDDNTSTSNLNSDSERDLSADIQIRRLTAQLTAAYNRIAALEEQILTYRIPS
ncbi:hypothetical protein [Myxosarcina sp. GI1(2024)]